MDPAPKASLCVFCRRHPAQAAWRPFCSERCRLQDLAKWADGSYRVPVNKTNADEFRIENSEFRNETDE